jgi:quinolinate synthase
MAVPPEGTGAAFDEVLYDLLEVRIIGLEMPAECRMFSSPNMLKMSILACNRPRRVVRMELVMSAALDMSVTLEPVGPLRARPSAPLPTRRTALHRFGPLPAPSIEWSAAVERDTAHLYDRVKTVVPSVEWPFFAPYIRAINAVKKERNAVILAHNYQTPEIFHCVADFVGDSLQLAREATKVKADVIVQAGVHFMAETAKILNPDKTVLIPDVRAGCSLASAITGEDVRLLRERFPGVPVVTYVNTSAEVKAESDITCTSSNALQVVESLGVDKVIFVPDQYLAKYVASQTKVKIIAWKGSCEVHERFTGDELAMIRANDPSVQIVAHPECPPDVIAASDFTGSTAHMIDWLRKTKPKRVVLVTECSMADNVQAELPEVEFTRPCNLCPHMKRITLPNILDSLLEMKEEVVVDAATAEKGRRAVERMIYMKS